MTREQITMMQAKIGAEPDGFWGPKSIAACQNYLRKLMPRENQWPKPGITSLNEFYGPPGNEDDLVVIEFPYPMFYSGKIVKKTRCHKKVAKSLLRVLTNIGDKWGNWRGIMEEAEDYGGCYNFRLKRGGATYSLHAYGAAIDLDPDDNQFRESWPMKADMPLEIMEEFSKEGWKSAGAFWGYDAMHFEATS